MNRQIYNGL